MTADQFENQDTDNTPNVPSELDTLKQRANLMGLRFHPSIGLENLREKVNAAVTGIAPTAPAAPVTEVAAPVVVPETEGQKRYRLKQEASRLIRIHVTCMNPAKKNWKGEIFTTGNKAVGTLKKYVPFNADEGWHVPQMIYQMMKDRQCPIFVEVPDGKGSKKKIGKMMKEFNIVVMDQLTQAELKDLAQRQAMAAGTSAS